LTPFWGDLSEKLSEIKSPLGKSDLGSMIFLQNITKISAFVDLLRLLKPI
jgi:hypothetical protein